MGYYHEQQGGGKSRVMGIAERVKNFLREREGADYCDDCIANTLGLKREQTQRAIRSFVRNEGFNRGTGLCLECVLRGRRDEYKLTTKFSK